MPEKIKKALVIGDGGWGTALALLLCQNEIDTTLWSVNPKQSSELAKNRENRRFLPGIPLPPTLKFSADPHSAAEGAELVCSVVPTQFLRNVAERFEDAIGGRTPIVSATKGLEIETFKTPSQILTEVLGDREICVLTGPSHAEEVAQGKPATVVAACKDRDIALLVQTAFTSGNFRVYTQDDPIGAELAGALKNVIALAAGISDGLELGDNAKAALLSRGMLEMARFGAVRGADPQTFFGLAGFGDLVTTCCSQHSRNRAVGEALGRGKKLRQILDEMEMVAEGVWTTKALFGPEAEPEEIDMPIAEQVHAVLFQDKDPREAVLDLMSRAPVDEMVGIRKSST